MITDPWFYVTAVLAVLIVGVAKGGLAGGIGIIGVPLMSLSISPIKAAAIMLPILMLMDVFALRTYWRRWHEVNLRFLLPGAVIGTAIGWLSFKIISAVVLKLLIGVIAVAYALNFFIQKGQAAATEASRGKATFWASLSGFTSFAIHAGGPPLHAYLLPQKLHRTQFQATTVAFFFVLNWLKLGPYFFLGQLAVPNLTTSLVLAPLAPLGIMLGAWLHHRIDDAWFFKVVYASLFLLGVKLIFDALI